jgi:hypothetical protein
MNTGFDNEWFSMHRDVETFSDSDFLPSQKMSIPQPEEVETLSPDDGGTDIHILSEATDTKRQKKHQYFLMAGSID